MPIPYFPRNAPKRGDFYSYFRCFKLHVLIALFLAILVIYSYFESFRYLEWIWHPVINFPIHGRMAIYEDSCFLIDFHCVFLLISVCLLLIFLSFFIGLLTISGFLGGGTRGVLWVVFGQFAINFPGNKSSKNRIKLRSDLLIYHEHPFGEP